MPKAVIVGAGINGLCAARALALRGWTVEVLERGPVPNPEAASFDRHRLIRAQYDDPGYAVRLPAAFAAWEALWRDLGRRHYVATGVLALSRAEEDWTDRARRAGSTAPVETLDAPGVAAAWPMLATEGVRFGLHAREGGVLFADRILADLAAWLTARGVAIRPHTPVERVDAASGQAVGPTGRFAGDVVALAAGVGLPALAPGLAGDLVPRRVVTLYARAPERWRGAWSGAPAWIDLGGDDELWGMPPVRDIPLKLGAGGLTRPGDPATERRVLPEDGVAVRAAYRGQLRDADDYAVESVGVNFYLAAPETRFVLRRDRRAVALSADSGHGFKFGPLTGADLADALEPGGFDAAAERVAGRAA